jgi:hypothetical protein
MFKIIEKRNTYQIMSILTAGLYFYLFVSLLFSPDPFLNDFGVEATAPAEFLARRVAMLMLGFAVLAFFGRKMSHSLARRAMALAIGVNMAGFAVMGLIEFAQGVVGAEILTAAAIESFVAVAYFLIWLADRGTESLEKMNSAQKS